MWVLGIELGKHAFLTAEILTMLTTPTMPLRGITPAVLVGWGENADDPHNGVSFQNLKKGNRWQLGGNPGDGNCGALWVLLSRQPTRGVGSGRSRTRGL